MGVFVHFSLDITCPDDKNFIKDLIPSWPVPRLDPSQNCRGLISLSAVPDSRYWVNVTFCLFFFFCSYVIFKLRSFNHLISFQIILYLKIKTSESELTDQNTTYYLIREEGIKPLAKEYFVLFFAVKFSVGCQRTLLRRTIYWQ